jgi:hypothetical protein
VSLSVCPSETVKNNNPPVRALNAGMDVDASPVPMRAALSPNLRGTPGQPFTPNAEPENLSPEP